MASVARRAASKLLRLLGRSGDPAAEGNRVICYTKDVGGTNQFFARTEDGLVVQLTPIVQVLDEAVVVGVRPRLNFVGANVQAVDNPGQNRIDVMVNGIPATFAPAVVGFGNGNIGAAADDRFLDPWYGGINEVSGTDRLDLIAPRAGVLQNLFVRHNLAIGNGNAVDYTVFLNGVATALTASLATGALGSASDLANMVAVAQGDRIALQASKAAAIGNGRISPVVTIEFTA